MSRPFPRFIAAALLFLWIVQRRSIKPSAPVRPPIAE